MLGDNDEWVPYTKTKEKFERMLGAEVVTIANGGHITSDDGFGEFPRLVEIVENKIIIITGASSGIEEETERIN